LITDDELENLPEDPELAFVKLEAILRSRTATALERADSNNVDEVRVDYISRILAAKRAFGLDFLSGWNVPTRENNLFETYSNFITEVDHHTTEIRVRHARRTRQYSIAFDPPAKERLRHLLEEMKKIVDRLEINVEMRQKIFDRIVALEAEINRERTRFEAFGALVVVAFEVGDEAVGKLRNVRRFVELIGTVFGKAKRAEQSTTRSLPRQHETKQIEPPSKKLPKPRRTEDDIPF
jgi:hypothetical protein